MPYDGNPSARLACEAEQLRLNELATKLTISALESFDNQVGDSHTAALRQTISTFTSVAAARLSGTTVIDLPTGMGKSTAMACWTKAVHELKLNMDGIVIAVEKIEAQQDTFKALTTGEMAIPAIEIGVWNGGQDQATPPTFPGQEAMYQNCSIIIITHARLKQLGSNTKALSFKGRTRSILLHDEALAPFELQQLHLPELLGQLRSLKTMQRPKTKIWHAIDRLEAALERETSCIDRKLIQPLNLTSDVEVGLDLILDAARSARTATMKTLIQYCEASDYPWDIVYVPSSGELKNTISRKVWELPDGLPPIVVLDASYPIYLSGLKAAFGSNVKDRYVTHYQPLVSPINGRYTKRYDNVSISLMHTSGSGRGWAVANSTSQDSEHGALINEAYHLLTSQQSETEATLVWSFKSRDDNKPNTIDMLMSKLEDEGIDTNQTIEHQGDQKPRLVFNTFGNEAASNAMVHCPNVLFLGGLEKPKNALAAEAAYRTNTKSFTNNRGAESLLINDIAANLFQAMSRGASRQTEMDSMHEVQAQRSNITIITRHATPLREILGKHLPGLKWHRITPQYLSEARCSPLEALVVALIDVVDDVGVEVNTLSMKTLKADVSEKVTNFSDRTFTRAIDVLCQRIGWTKKRRSILRLH